MVDYKFESNPKSRVSETSPFDWTEDRFNHVIRQKEEAIEHAINMKVDYLFVSTKENFTIL